MDTVKNEKPALLIVTELYPNTHNAFLGTFVVRQLEALAAWYRIIVITTQEISLRDALTGRFRQPERTTRREVWRVGYYPFWLAVLQKLHVLSRSQAIALNKQVTSRRMFQLARRLHAQYNFKLVHGHEVYIGDEAIPMGQRLKIPSIFTLHGLYSYHRQGFGAPAMSLIMKNLRRSTSIIAVSHVAANSYISKGISSNVFSYVPNGITPYPQETPNPDVLRFAHGQLTLLSAGFLVPEKRVDFAIEALASLRQKGYPAVLVIVGQGSETERLQRLVNTLGLQSCVHFAGTVAPEQLSGYYFAADIVLHPSVVDSFSMVGLEAMSCGKPVVCTNAIGLAEYTTNYQDIITVAPDNQAAFTAAVEQLIVDSAARTRIGVAARETSKKFLIEHIAKRIRNIYDHALTP